MSLLPLNCCSPKCWRTRTPFVQNSMYKGAMEPTWTSGGAPGVWCWWLMINHLDSDRIASKCIALRSVSGVDDETLP